MATESRPCARANDRAPHRSSSLKNRRPWQAQTYAANGQPQAGLKPLDGQFMLNRQGQAALGPRFLRLAHPAGGTQGQ